MAAQQEPPKQESGVETENVEVKQQATFFDEEGKGLQLDYSGAHAKVDPAEIKLVKKLDRWIMPMLWAMYWLNYLDRNAIALARLDNLEDELGISDSQYATCVSILFVGYIAMQVPSSTLIFVTPCSSTPLLTLSLPYRHAVDSRSDILVHGRLHAPVGYRQHPNGFSK